jgi:2-keto-4-pentenoate hydratase/2-oxohepta-3-ene-1,7-dioic acid hydratase in catechol pathway
MRLVTWESGGEARAGVVRDRAVVDLGAEFASVLDVIAAGSAGLERCASVAAAAGSGVPLDQVRLLAPIPAPRRDLFAVGWNYREHFLEGQRKRGGDDAEPEFPAFFTKATGTVIGPYDDIAFDARVSERMDYEAELVVVVGTGGRSIPEAKALEHVFGYMAGNDVSARDLQRRHGGQWIKGKSIDHTCPLGPWLVTADEVADPQALDLRCRLNGEVMQESTTALMIFPVARLIAELSLGMTLLPGDLLMTGTPSGVGFARDPAVWLRPGDEVVVEIDGVGELRNRVADIDLIGG